MHADHRHLILSAANKGLDSILECFSDMFGACKEAITPKPRVNRSHNGIDMMQMDTRMQNDGMRDVMPVQTNTGPQLYSAPVVVAAPAPAPVVVDIMPPISPPIQANTADDIVF
eukprot:gnl/Dysnectes_brevis/1760_a2007_1578.p2 GENE.gnl/Dysnectes_brevis/1760_a2007_1578~~gnl/Dysnectes_brevis/1760_a2007_1578.p2  ORF type:complete len:114 (+),score=20.24 gnl/Dysnectes_brevis/1760_a2007_1578:506-847(+)